MTNGIKYANNVMNALIAADPDDADYFRKRGSEYIQQLETLDTDAKAQFSSIPTQYRKILTSHDALVILVRNMASISCHQWGIRQKLKPVPAM